MLQLIDAAISVKAAHIAVQSTTSVYGDATNEVVSEVSTTQPQTASAKAHVTIEDYLLSKRGQVDISIVRCLSRPRLSPRPLVKWKTVRCGNKRINLAHVYDIVSALTTIICGKLLNDVIHLCSLSHPKRGIYYVDAAKAMDIDVPRFSDTGEPAGKVIDAAQSWQG